MLALINACITKGG